MTSAHVRRDLLLKTINAAHKALVASKGGDDRDPDWYHNLVANPNVTLEPIGGNGPVALSARTATADEKAELWPRIASAAEGYAAYTEKTDRDIPVVICEPII